MADGGVRIDVGLNISKAEKDLAKLKEKIFKLEDEINTASDRKPILQKELGEVGNQLDKATAKVRELKKELRGARGSHKGEIADALHDAVEEQSLLNKQLNELNSEYDRVVKTITEGGKQLAELNDEAANLTMDIETQEQENAAKERAESLSEGFTSAKDKLKSFLKAALGIATAAALFKKLSASIKESVLAFAEEDEETKASIQGLRDALEQLKLNWGAAFAPILNAVAPLLQTLIDWLTAATNAVAKFIAIVSGRTTYKRAIKNNQGLSSSLGGVAAAAQEAKRQLMGFDELNVLNGQNTGGGGGGGAGGTDSGLQTIEEALDPYDDSFLSSLALSVKDVIFDWDDLNPEQIAEKAIAGLSALLGMATGFVLGGVPGAILGTLLGLTIGLVADALIFDHDGTISQTELTDMILLALNGLIGGVVGFILAPAGNKMKGTLLGASIGIGLTVLIKGLQAKADGKDNGFLDFLVGAMNMFVGGVIGFAVSGGNIAGAVVGTLAGFVLTLVLENIKAKNKLRESFYETEFGQEVQRIKDEANALLEEDADLRVRINSITGELDENTVADFALAKQLIDDIFTLDAQDNKTAEEMEVLRAKIEMLNSLGLEGIQLQFDETTGRVIGSREQVQGLLEDLLEEYRIEAMREAYVEAWKAQYEATDNVRKATKNAGDAQSAYQQAVDKAAEAQDEYNRALDTYNLYADEINSGGSGGAVSEAALAAQENLQKAKAALDDAKLGLEEAKGAAEISQSSLTDAMVTYDQAVEKVTDIENNLTDLVTTSGDTGREMMTELGEKVEENAPQAEEDVRAAAEAAATKLSNTLEGKGSEAADQLIDDFNEEVTNKSSEAESTTEDVGKNTVKGFFKGMEERWHVDEPWIVTLWKKLIELIKGPEVLDEGSPSRVFEDIGSNLVQGFWDGISNTWSDFIGFFEGLWENLSSWWSNLTLSPFHIPHPVFEWGTKAAEGLVARALQFVGLEPVLPTLAVSWMAKGGVLDRATLIGAGEAGKEAIVPLERNTEWITMVANGLLDRLARGNYSNQLAEAFMSTARPAMAGGFIAPPNAFSTGYSGDWGGTLLEELRALRGEINALASQPMEVTTRMMMDKREIGRAVTAYQRDTERARG